MWPTQRLYVYINRDGSSSATCHSRRLTSKMPRMTHMHILSVIQCDTVLCLCIQIGTSFGVFQTNLKLECFSSEQFIWDLVECKCCYQKMYIESSPTARLTHIKRMFLDGGIIFIYAYLISQTGRVDDKNLWSRPVIIRNGRINV